MDPQRLQSLAAVPRELTPALLRIRRKPFFLAFGARKRWAAGLRRGPLVLAYVIQANAQLFDPSRVTYAPAVVVYSENPKVGLDGHWITALGERIGAAKETPSGDPMVDGMAAFLRTETTHWNVEVPRQITEDVPVRMAVHRFDSRVLMGGCVPAHRLVPFLLFPDGPYTVPRTLFE